jgi:hypothetical protein
LLILLLLALPVFVLGRRFRAWLWRGTSGRLLIAVCVVTAYTALLFNLLGARRMLITPAGVTLGIAPGGNTPLELYLLLGLHGMLVSLLAVWLWRRFHPDDFGK